MKSYKETVMDIRDIVRKRASILTSLKCNAGCIRILFRPLCEEADNWANGFGFNPADVTEYETVFTLTPSCTHTTTTTTESINHYGLSALQIASCSKNRAKHGIRLSFSSQSSYNPSIQPINGYLNRRGCVCYTVIKAEGKKDIEWARFYISVSGGIDTENENAATEGYKALGKVFTRSESFRVV